MRGRLRTFVAIEMDEGVRAGLAGLMGRLETRASGVRLADPATIHLTLRFLGDVDQRDVAAAGAALAGAVRGIAPFDVDVAGIGAFPRLDTPRVIWAGVQDPTGALGRLHAAVVGCLADLGKSEEDRAFTPHLTLGRMRGRSGSTALMDAIASEAALSLGQTPVDEVVLFMSEIGRGGPTHTALARIPLEG